MPAGLPQRVLRALADARSVDEAIDATLAQIAASFDVPLADLWLFGELDETMLWAGDFATVPSLAEFRDLSRHLTFGPGVGLPGRVVATGAPELIEDLGADLAFVRARAAAEAGLVRAIAAPLVGPDGPLGAVEVFGTAEVELGQIEMDALDGAARQLAAYLGRRLGSAEPPVFVGFVRDISDRRRADTENERLLADAITSRALAEAAQTRSAAAQDLAEEVGHRLALLARVGERLLAAREEREIADAVVSEVVPELAEWCEITLTGPRQLPRIVASSGQRPAFEHLFTVPLRTARGELGTMAFALISEDAAPVARTLCARVALAVDNVRLLAERTHIAETLQRSLLPARLPSPQGFEVAARYRAAGAQNLVGGDFYDVFESADGSWTAILGDVSGKGPEAAAITALSRHTLRAGAFREPSPMANLRLLNDALLAASDGEWRFATVLYARICDSVGGAAITVCTGGHLPPLVRRADGTLEEVPIRGTVLGAVADPTLDDHELQLGPGDLMLLYTDGVTEIRPQQPNWGDDLLLRTVEAHGDGPLGELVKEIERTAIEAQEGEPRDDIALLALRVPS